LSSSKKRQEKRMIKAIFFDIDNTLIDFMTMKHKSCEAAIDAMISAGLKVERKRALAELFKLYREYGIEEKEIFQKLLKKLQKKVDYRLVAHGIIAYRKIKESQLYPYPHVIPTLIELKKKYKVAIISDAPRMRAWLRLVTMQLDDFFDIVITAADVRKTKDKKIPFKVALNKLGIKPQEALMVGDRISRDIAPAKAIGIKTCYARYGAKYNTEKPIARGKSKADYEINDIQDLIKLKL